MTYAEFFQQAMRSAPAVRPFEYQRQLAEEVGWRQSLHVPTGLGKTAAVVLAWLWKQRIAGDPDTPRRLVYCLPMRVLVEQVRDTVRNWLRNLDLASEVRVEILMGGEVADDWDLYPEREAILIGTQDMLVSRALNRGYGASRYRWPMQFGLLNNDCLWVLDEVQLMGSGLATTAQLAAFRQRLGDGLDGQPRVRSLWMSATLAPDWLRTVDFEPDPTSPLGPSTGDKIRSPVFQAGKPIERARAAIGEREALAREIVSAHQPQSRTLVVLNTVARARDLYREIAKRKPAARLVLIHSHFRLLERQEKVRQLLEEPPAEGAIIVSTQVVEAGVDVSARTLFTELAPWASMVQRFGRCNRRGEFGAEHPARVVWIDLPAGEKQQVELARPYDLAASLEARELLGGCSDGGVGLASLERIQPKLEFDHTHVIRCKDVIELFDTTPDLAGNDIDIDHYVRDSDSSDVQVFWRELGERAPASDALLPSRGELCPAPIGEFKGFLEALRKAKLAAYRRNYVERKWEVVSDTAVYPGQVFMLDCAAGGYSAELGWTGQIAKAGEQPVSTLPSPSTDRPIAPDDSLDADALSQINAWQTLAEHSDAICAELEKIVEALSIPEPYRTVLLIAARWHDLGKAHWVFRHAVPLAGSGRDPFDVWAKAHGRWNRYERGHFRHELASALAVLQECEGLIPREHRNLIAYLVAAHHGKVRMSIRSMPNENRPLDPEVRFARGVWDGDELPQADLGSGVIAPAVTLSLEPMELGLASDGSPSWAERMLALRDDPALGPFRLTYLEALVRAADIRVSMEANRL